MAPQRHSGAPLLAFLTTTDRIQDHPGGVLGPIWRGPARRQQQPGGLARMVWLPGRLRVWGLAGGRERSVRSVCSRLTGAETERTAGAHLGCGTPARVPATRATRTRAQRGSLRKSRGRFSDPQHAGSWTMSTGHPFEVEERCRRASPFCWWTVRPDVCEKAAQRCGRDLIGQNQQRCAVERGRPGWCGATPAGPGELLPLDIDFG